jgi:flagellar basal-body rod modification protein FlgD
MDVSSINKPTTAAQQSTKNAAETQDRFLKLLVAQMKNQDPMNPMDNAQVTSQMAQIQTVSGVSTLDTSIKNLSSQFTQMQALQSVSLVGRPVTVEGNKLNMVGGVGEGGYTIDSAADQVKLEVLNGAGGIVDTVQLGAQSKGRQTFKWEGGKDTPDAKYQFRITASKGTSTIPSTPFSMDKVLAVNTGGTHLQLQLKNAGLVDYGAVKTID